MQRKFFQMFFIQSWWVIAFGLFCFLIYEQELKKRDSQYRQLNDQLQTLQSKKIDALNEQKNLQLQVNSQSDLAWIELKLMKGLGLTPEDHQKIYFSKEEKETFFLRNERMKSAQAQN